MLVLCHSNLVSSLPASSAISQNRHRYYGKGTESLSLTVQQTYVVYATRQDVTGAWFFVADDLFSDIGYPFAYPSFFFYLIDGRLSRYWTKPKITEADGQRTEFRAFKEWVSDRVFYERLIDGSRSERDIFCKYKELMDLEFPNPMKYRPIVYIDNDWCQCDACGHVWENHQSDNGMLRCPQCRKVFIDPRWTEPSQQETLFT